MGLKQMAYRWRLDRLRAAGLQMSNDCRLMSWPRWGSEPYLISIGKHVTIASGVVFINHDGGTWVFRGQSRYVDVIKYGRITIHDNCFIGSGVILLPGIEIGPNSVVAAGSVVNQSVPPDTVAGGVPARVLMSVDEYAERCVEHMPTYDRAAYARDKKSELLRLFPRPW